ncbi:hypothetical protein [Spongiactinospora sp. TRM90649]|uniref:hypothetical protein n=1 Tax=Spongiactinospora sp. TRM90649 TaxID=3031114 RepID=UPI0023F8A86E|nr:hypothetical protein [Spongiactinospora sp. TRM90649]MDF5756718.1 hypothetical protein [Spongiactinospora sp. TRM90649]
MTGVASPLQYGDPPSLGPFVIQARLRVGPAGLVYLGQAPDGRAVSVALLTRGAAFDAAARDRFVTGIREAVPERGGMRGWVARRSARRTAVLESAPPVLAMDVGPAPWVATPYVPGRPGAERFLEPVLVGGTLIGERHGPDFVPHWIADRVPAVPAPPRPKPPPTETRRSVVVAGAVLALMLAMLSLVVWLVFGRAGEEADPARPLPPTMFVPTPPPVPVSPVPREPTPSPSPGDSEPGSPAPEGGDDGEGEPI